MALVGSLLSQDMAGHLFWLNFTVFLLAPSRPDLAALNGHTAMEYISCCCQLGVCGRLGRNVLRQQDGARAVQPFVPLFCPAAMEPNILRQRFLTELHREVRPIDLLAVQSVSGVHHIMGLTLP